jgi:hypothetical protein
MKKFLLVIIALLVSGVLMAQGSKGKLTNKSFLVFHGGISITPGDFGSRDLNNDKAGLAMTGINLNLAYGYHFIRNLGVTATFFYNRHEFDNYALLNAIPGVATDHWQWYGIVAGPMLTHQILPKLTGNIRVMGGIANANTPKFTVNKELMIQEDWQAAPLFRSGLDLQYHTGGNVFLYGNADYMWMQPEFKVIDSYGIVTDRRHQTITVINLTAGVGFNF